MNGKVVAICIGPAAGQPMELIQHAHVIADMGLEGDRYCVGQGSFNKCKTGQRQITFMNTMFFVGSGYTYLESRRNIFVAGIELMWLIGREFQVGSARFKGLKYCDPCDRPTKLAQNKRSFKEAFFDRGGIIAQVIQTGRFNVGDEVIPPPKGY